MHAPSRRDVSVAAIALAMLAAARNASAQTPDEAPLSDDQIRSILAERVPSEAPGMVIGIVSPAGSRIFCRGAFGASDKRPVGANTIFGIASVSKAFTGLLLADSIRRKEVKLTDPAALYMPKGLRLPERNGRRIALIDLATHTTCLPHDLPPDLRTFAATKSTREARAVMYDYLSNWTLPADIGSTFAYSNLDYGVIGIALEQRTGLSYDQLLRTRILDQLRMDDTGISISPSQWERRAHPHAADLSASPEFNKPWSISTLQSTANDLLTFLAAAAGVVPSPLTPAFDAMLTTRRPAPMLGHGVEQAIGWYVRPLASGRLVGHSGSGGGFGASALYDPATRTGVAILANAESIWEDVAVHALRPSIPMNRKQTGVTLSNAAMDALTGRYVDSTGAAWIVVREAAGLLLHHPQGYKVPLTPESEQHFSVQGFPTLTIEFEKDVAGITTTLTWTMGQASTSARRIAG